jgi:hypothetical protein
MLCPHCDYEVEKDFLRCPTCLRKLRDPCGSCGRPLDPVWKICPYCEAEVGAAAPRQARRARRTAPASAAGERPPSRADSPPATRTVERPSSVTRSRPLE